MRGKQDEKTAEMTKEDLEYFVTGLVAMIDDRGLVQLDIAKRAGVSEINLSRVLNRRAGCSAKWRRKICVALGVFEEDVIKKGVATKHTSAERLVLPPPQSMVPGIAAGHVNPNDVMSAVSALVGQYQKNDERMRFWRLIFDQLPVPTLIIKDGLVCYQNMKSRELGNIAGTELCSSCINKGCDRKDCPVAIAVENKTAQSGFRNIGTEKYKVNVVPLIIAEHNYVIVTATPVCICLDDRRTGQERRGEIQDQ